MDRESLSAVFDAGSSTLLKIGGNDVADIVTSLIAMADEQDAAVVYVGVKESYLQVRAAALEQEVSVEHARFIDGVLHALPDSDIPEEDGVVYVDRNDSLMNISTAVSTLAGDVDREQVVVVLDSLRACIRRHSVDDVTAFIRSLQDQLLTSGDSIVLFDEGAAVEAYIGAAVFDIVDKTLFIED